MNITQYITNSIARLPNGYVFTYADFINKVIDIGAKRKSRSIGKHDKKIFDEPENWQSKKLAESPLITDFINIWQQLKEIYKTELSALAFNDIPNEKEVYQSFEGLIKLIK